MVSAKRGGRRGLDDRSVLIDRRVLSDGIGIVLRDKVVLSDWRGLSDRNMLSNRVVLCDRSELTGRIGQSVRNLLCVRSWASCVVEQEESPILFLTCIPKHVGLVR